MTTLNLNRNDYVRQFQTLEFIDTDEYVDDDEYMDNDAWEDEALARSATC